MPEIPAFSSLTYQHVGAFKAILAFAAAVLLLWWWFEERRDRPRCRKLRRVALAVMGVLGLLGWWNFGRFHFGGGSIHDHEFFHYYLGAKYFHELGYTGLYDCAAAVEIADGRASELPSRWVRDLETNHLRTGAANITAAQLCRDRFTSSPRWDAFRRDVLFFRERMSPQKRLDALSDHGYNATPVWTLTGRLLPDLAPASLSQVRLLSWLDPALVLVMCGFIWWGFGWQVLCVALIWWGTNHPARYTFIGGAYLRQDWLLMAIASLCFAKRGFMAASGFTLAWSVLLRVFPVFILLGLAFKVAADCWRTRSLRFAPEHRRFGGGLVAALLVLGTLSLTVTEQNAGPVETWQSFAANSQKHLATPLTNHMGLPTVVSFSPSARAEVLSRLWLDEPWDMWKDGRRRLFSERRVLYGVLVVVCAALLVAAVRFSDDWVALTLGIGAISAFAELTCYYYSVVLGLAFLWPRYPFAGVGLAVTSFLCGITPAVFSYDDDRYVIMSALILVYVGVVWLTVAVHNRDARLAIR